MAQHRVVIRHRRPWIGVIALTVGLALLTVGGYAAWRYLSASERVFFRGADSERGQLREDRRRLSRELRAARSELEHARSRGTFETRGCEIDAQACAAVAKSVASLENEVAQLREQLAFYRTIVSPEQARAGVRVQRLVLRAGAAEGVWRYELVLMQPVQRDRKAMGSYDFALEGLMGKQLKALDLADLSGGDPEPRSFSFRSYQEFGGELRLPDGFLPSRLTVTLEVQDGPEHANEVTEAFDWSRLTAARKE